MISFSFPFSFPHWLTLKSRLPYTVYVYMFYIPQSHKMPRGLTHLLQCLLAAQDGFSNVGGELHFGDIGTVTVTVVILTTAVETVTLENWGNDSTCHERDSHPEP